MRKRIGMKISKTIGVLAFACGGLVVSLVDQATAQPQDRGHAVEDLLAGNFRWTASGPLLGINPKNLPASPDNPWVAVKDPSIVHFQGRWHLFCSLRK